MQRHLRTTIDRWHLPDDLVEWAFTVEASHLQCRKYTTRPSSKKDDQYGVQGGGNGVSGGGHDVGSGVMQLQVQTHAVPLRLTTAEWAATTAYVERQADPAALTRLALARQQLVWRADQQSATLPILRPTLRRTIQVGANRANGVEILDLKTCLRIDVMTTPINVTLEPSQEMQTLLTMAPLAQFITVVRLRGHNEVLLIARVAATEAAVLTQLRHIIAGQPSTLTYAVLPQREGEEVHIPQLHLRPVGVLLLPPSRVLPLKKQLTSTGEELPTLAIHAHGLRLDTAKIKHCLPEVHDRPCPPTLHDTLALLQHSTTLDLTHLTTYFSSTNGIGESSEGWELGPLLGQAVLNTVTCNLLKGLAATREADLLWLYELDAERQLLTRLIYVEPDGTGNMLYCVLDTEIRDSD